MRKLPSELVRRLSLKAWTPANNADPYPHVWISRPGTVAKTGTFIERQLIGNFPGLSTAITNPSIAVRRMRINKPSDRIYAAYVASGRAGISYADIKIGIESQVWLKTSFSVPATAIAICFDGTMPKARSGTAQFITESEPWVFWISGGVVYAQKFGSTDITTLATANATAITAVRAMHSDVGGFDFGLVLFMILNGSIYYRQFVDGEWSDSVPINFGPAKSWVTIAASRTWDYRVALQAKASDGSIYELFTQFAGIAKQNTEHIEISNLTAKGILTALGNYSFKAADEHIKVANISAGALYNGLYSISVPNIISVQNEDDGTGDWGKRLIITFDVHLQAATVTVNATRFILTDSRNATYTASTAALGTDGKTVILIFTNFNSAQGECIISYTPGTIVSMAETIAESTSKMFIPRNLYDPGINPPKPVEVWNE